MGVKYFTISIDDGTEQDRKIVKILKKYGLTATFNLNSGIYGQKNEIIRVGDIGFYDMPIERYNRKQIHFLPHGHLFRIPADEIKDVYDGFEIASHTSHHVNLKRVGKEETWREIESDIHSLSEMFGQKITGFVYPQGAMNPYCSEVLKKNGILYARTVRKANDFHFPEDPYALPMTCWHFQGDVFSKMDRFEDYQSNDDSLFVLFAHGYEFDFNTKTSNWSRFEEICRKIASMRGVVNCSLGEAFARHLMNQR